jgi:hypothetical protein
VRRKGAGAKKSQEGGRGWGGGGRLHLVPFDGNCFSKIVCHKSDANHAPHRCCCSSARFRERQPHFLLNPLGCAPDCELDLTHNIVGAGQVPVHDAYMKNGTAADIVHLERTVEHGVHRIREAWSLEVDFGGVGRRVCALDDDVRVARPSRIDLEGVNE